METSVHEVQSQKDQTKV